MRETVRTLMRRRASRPKMLTVAVAFLATLAWEVADVAAEEQDAPSVKPKVGHRTPPAHTRQDLAAAKEAYEDALRAFNLGQWDEAVAGFQKSYKLSGDAALLFNIAQAQRQAGNVKEAIIAYKAFLREKPDTSQREMVEAKLKELESVAGNRSAPAEPATPRASSDQMMKAWEEPSGNLPPMPAESRPRAAQPPLAATAPTVPVTPIAQRSPALTTNQVVPAARVARQPPATVSAFPQVGAGPTQVSLPPGSEPVATQPNALDLHQQPASGEEAVVSNSRSRWWLWTGIGAVIVGGVVTAVLLSTGGTQRDSTCPSGLDGCVPVGK